MEHQGLADTEEDSTWGGKSSSVTQNKKNSKCTELRKLERR